MPSRPRHLRFTRRPWRYYLGITLGWAAADAVTYCALRHHAHSVLIPACVLLGTILGYAWEHAAIRKEGDDDD